MNILNGNEAFSALMAGKNIMCRAVGGLTDFTDLDQFPATVFAMPDYEFCIKIDSIELAGISFLKPFSIDELVADQEIYICENYSRITKCQFIPDRVEMRDAVISGFVQRDRENAANQIKAIQKALGIETEIYFQEVDYKELLAALATKNREPKKRETRKKTDVNLDVAKTVTPKGTESTDEPWGEAKNNTSEVVETHKPNSRPADDIKGSVCNLNDAPPKEEIKPVVEQSTADDLYASFEYQIEQATTTEDLMKIRSTFSANGTLSDEQHKDLNECFSGKLADLNTSGITIIAQGHIDIIEDSLSNEEIVQKANEDQYQKLLAELIERAQKAGSPKEANALYKYTVEWTEEQRKPLMSTITKRLNELNVDAPQVSEPPSLMVQIQTAPDLTALDALEIDVSSRHPDIQPKLMSYVKARRFELENGVTQ